MINRENYRRGEVRPPLRVLESKLPSNENAESMVLGTLINFPGKLDEVVDQLSPDDFYFAANKAVYEAMLAYLREHGEAPDILSLYNWLVEQERSEDADNVMRVKILADEPWSTNLKQDLALVLGPAQQRRTIHAAGQLAAMGYETTNPEKLRNQVEKVLYDLTMTHAPASDFQPIESVLERCVKRVERASQNRGKLTGITTGFHDLDLMTGGWQQSDLILLAARPSVGKTSLAMGMAYRAARAGHAVAVFSLEMAAEQLGMRLLSLVARVPSNRLRSGWLEEDEWNRVVEAQDHLSELCLHIDDTSGSPVSSIRSKLRRLKAKIHRPIDLVIVDYIGLMDSDEETDNRVQEIDRISRGLKAIARDFDTPVIALSQLSRKVEERQSKVPQLSDLRDSGGLEQNADLALFIYRDELYNDKSERKGQADVIVAKQRNGPVGEVTLAWNGALTRFDNLEDSHE